MRKPFANPSRRTLAALVLTGLGGLSAAVAQTVDDPFQWLEEVQGEKALAWAKEHNAKSTAVLEARPEYKPIYKRTLEILDSKEKIPTPELLGDTVYNFWKDDAHERGIWRRTTLASYRTAAPQWETVLDVDALAKADGKAWVFHGANCLPPAYVRCMVSLSPGGSDASVEREFDTKTKEFVSGGFSLPEAKSRVAWRDEDTLWVGTDFGPGSLTTSGYPRIVKLWKRGTPLSAARTVFEGKTEDVGSGGRSEILSDGRYDLVTRTPAFFRGESVPLPRRPPGQAGPARGRAAARLLPRPAPLLAAKRLDGRRQDVPRGIASLRNRRRPPARRAPVRRALRAERARFARRRGPHAGPGAAPDARQREQPPHGALPRRTAPGSAPKSRRPGSAPRIWRPRATSRNLLLHVPGLHDAASLWLSEKGGAPAKVKSMPAFFDATGITTEQFEATSKDGTKIPYFVVRRRAEDGRDRPDAPLRIRRLRGLGGPHLQRTHRVRVALARRRLRPREHPRRRRVRPAWHKAAVKEKHIHNFEDFSAVAQDLTARKITSARHLGIMGGSQGGLLVGGTLALYPDLFHAVVAQVPLADMKRFNHLLAGASWMAEYGDPDKPEDWAYIQTWSPYQLLKPDAKYPTPFFWTNTRDDRVHPAHARKMVAKLEAQGHPVYYFENTEGGHGSGAVNKQTAQVTALQYAYLWMMLP